MTTHIPVLTGEALLYLQPERGGLFVDCTVGLGGHARALLEAGATRILGFDRDPAASPRRATTWRRGPIAWSSSTRTIARSTKCSTSRRIDQIDGALADLGISSMQLEAEGRGFSFQRDEPLDMRMDPTSGETAADLVAQFVGARPRGRHLQVRRRALLAADRSRRSSKRVTTRRSPRPGSSPRSSGASVPRRGYMRIDPATRTFQALRIWVNRELEGLDRFIEAVVRRLRTGRRLVVITFHSLEDRIVEAHAACARSRRAGPGPRADQETGGAWRRRGPEQPAGPKREAACGRTAGDEDGRATMAEPFEYAIKKDVRNNPIVREVDEARHRELWKSVALAAFLVLVLLFSAWQHFELLRHGYRVEQMQRDRAAEEEAARHLRLEIDTLRAPQRIEALATRRLHLVAPAQGRGDRHRARRARRAARFIRGGAAVALMQPPAPDWRQTIKRRLVVAVSVLALLGARHRGAACLPADGAAPGAAVARRQPAQPHPAGAGKTRRHRRSARQRPGHERGRRFGLRRPVRAQGQSSRRSTRCASRSESARIAIASGSSSASRTSGRSPT